MAAKDIFHDVLAEALKNEGIYDQFFVLPFIQESLIYNGVSYLVYDVDTKVIVQWKK